MGRKKRNFNTEEIKRLYLEEKLSSHAIGRRVGAYHGQIIAVLKKAGTDRRTKSEAVSLWHERNK